jgi:DNA polymerase III alpha subunit
MSLPRPPSTLVAARLSEAGPGTRIAVAGLVLVRQRPGTARGVVFLTLEDETGVINVVIWRKVFERFRRAVIAARLLRVTGRVERQAGVIHLVAEEIEDISHLLDLLADPAFSPAISPPPRRAAAPAGQRTRP